MSAKQLQVLEVWKQTGRNSVYQKCMQSVNVRLAPDWLSISTHHTWVHKNKQTELPQPPLPPPQCPAPLGPVLFMGREWLLRAWSQQNCPDRWQHLLFLSSKSFKPATKSVVWPQRTESFLYVRVCCLWGNSVFIFVNFCVKTKPARTEVYRWSQWCQQRKTRLQIFAASGFLNKFTVF